MGYFLLSIATAMALIRGSFLQWKVARLLDENDLLREKLAKFDRVKGEHGRFVSTRKISALEKFIEGHHGLIG